jgi:hypothetical protein
VSGADLPAVALLLHDKQQPMQEACADGLQVRRMQDTCMPGKLDQHAQTTLLRNKDC